MSFILNFSFWMCSRLHANDCKRGRNAIKIPVLSQSTVVRSSSAPFSFSLYAEIRMWACVHLEGVSTFDQLIFIHIPPVWKHTFRIYWLESGRFRFVQRLGRIYLANQHSKHRDYASQLRHPRYNHHHYAPLSVCSAVLSCYGWQLCREYRKAIEENFVLKKDIKVT